MDWLTALVVIIGGYYILDLALTHREKMAKLKKDDK